MTATCPVVPLDLGSPYATLLEAKSPTEITRRGVDWSDWLICNSSGVLINSSVWVIHSDDDDTTLALSQPTIGVANVASVLVSGGTVGQSYRLVNTVTLDDGQSIAATVQIPVRDVFKQALAA